MQPSRRWPSTKGSIMPWVVAASRIHLSERIAMPDDSRPQPRGQPRARVILAELLGAELWIEVADMIEPLARLAQHLGRVVDLEPQQLGHAAHEMDAVAALEAVIFARRGAEPLHLGAQRP